MLRKKILIALFCILASMNFAGTSQAALSAVSTDAAGAVLTNPANGFPVWDQDFSGVTLEQCNFSAASPDPNCIPAGPAGVPIPGIDFEEAFWWAADASAPDQGNVSGTLLVLGIEAAFATGEPVAGQQVVFGRIRVRVDVAVAGTYTVTHPFGVNTYNVTTPGVRAINDTIDVGVAVGDFRAVLGTTIGPFLRCVTPAPPAGYLGNFGVPCTVTGSPNGTNIFRIVGPGTDTSTNQFNVSGKLFTGQVPTPVTVQRATYTRSADPGNPGRINVYATAAPTASLQVTGTGLPTVAMAGDGTGKFFVDIPLASATTLPPTVLVIASNPALPNNLPSLITMPLIDLVTITAADYDVATRTLTVQAISSDAAVPPTLTAVGLGALTAGSVAVVTPAPPASVIVQSSVGGEDNHQVTVVGIAGPAPVNILPVANNDGPFRTTPGIAVAINVLANDTDVDGTIVPSSITIVPGSISPAGSGTATLNATTGIVTFTPAAGFAGVASFVYNVADNLGAVSNPATVTITVSAAATAETLTISRADFRLPTGPYDIRVTSTVPGARITIRVGPTVAGPVIATVVADAVGAWRFNGTSTAPGAETTISVQSTGGASLLGFPLTIR